jgi:hypothetical protein
MSSSRFYASRDDPDPRPGVCITPSTWSGSVGSGRFRFSRSPSSALARETRRYGSGAPTPGLRGTIPRPAEPRHPGELQQRAARRRPAVGAAAVEAQEHRPAAAPALRAEWAERQAKVMRVTRAGERRDARGTTERQAKVEWERAATTTSPVATARAAGPPIPFAHGAHRAVNGCACAAAFPACRAAPDRLTANIDPGFAMAAVACSRAAPIGASRRWDVVPTATRFVKRTARAPNAARQEPPVAEQRRFLGVLCPGPRARSTRRRRAVWRAVHSANLVVSRGYW